MAISEVIIESGPIDLSDILPKISPGYDWEWAFYVLDDNDDPVDTTDWACEIKIKDKANGETKATLSTATGEIVNTPATGEFAISYVAAGTALLDCRQVVFDVKTTDASGGVDRPFKATIEVDEVVA